MKSYFLAMLTDPSEARKELTLRCPRQTEPWIIDADDGDAIAYLDIYEALDFETGGPFFIKADISGRHDHEDERVIDLLRSLRAKLGGVVWDDFDRPV